MTEWGIWLWFYKSYGIHPIKSSDLIIIANIFFIKINWYYCIHVFYKIESCGHNNCAGNFLLKVHLYTYSTKSTLFFLIDLLTAQVRWSVPPWMKLVKMLLFEHSSFSIYLLLWPDLGSQSSLTKDFSFHYYVNCDTSKRCI